MSDGEAAAGQKESQFIRPKLKATRVKVFACILALFGALVISIQVYVYVTFEYVGQQDSLIPDMFLVTNATAMASGLLAFLSGILSLACVTHSRSSSTLKFNVFLQVMDAILAVAGLVLASILSDNINTDTQVCDTTTTNCSLFFGLQVGVAALCGADFILSLALIIIISIGVRGGRQQTKSTTSQIQPVQEVEPVETIIHQQLVPIPEEIIQVESVQFQEPSVEIQEPEVQELSPIEQLKFLSREELERRLQEHFQHQFLEELRSELNRRNLTEPDSLKEPANNNPEDYDLQTEHVF